MTRKTLKQTRLLNAGEGDVQQVDEKLQVLLHRLGIDALPSHESCLIAIERILIPGEELLARPSQRLVRSIARVGILQAPSVMLCPSPQQEEGDTARTGIGDDDEPMYITIMGRRRILAARLLGLPVVRCEVYASGTPQLRALLSLMENEQRSAAWVKEVQDLRQLIDERVGMTLDDLAEFGFDRNSLTERLKIAQLPRPLLNLIFAGKMRLDVAKRIARLNPVQQGRVAHLAEESEEITPERVRDVLRSQINNGLAPLQTTLEQQGWPSLNGSSPITTTTTIPMQGYGEEFTMQGGVENGGELLLMASPVEAMREMTPRMMASVLTVLESFERQARTDQALQSVHTLTRALIQQLQVILRQMPRYAIQQEQQQRQEQHERQQKEEREGENAHV